MRMQAFSFKPLHPDSVQLAAAAAAAAKAKAVEEVPKEPVFSAEDIATAESNGFVKGLAEGQSKAHEEARTEAAKRDEILSSLAENLVQQAKTLSQAQRKFFEEQSRNAGNLARAITRKVAGQALSSSPLAEIEVMVTECLPMLIGQPKMMISLHPTLVEALRQRLEPQLKGSGFEGECQIQGDEKLAQTDCRIEWKNGAVEKNQEALWKDIENVIDRSVQKEVVPAPAPIETVEEKKEEKKSET